MLLLLLIVTVVQVSSYSGEVACTFFLQGYTLVHRLMRFLRRMPYLNHDAMGGEGGNCPNRVFYLSAEVSAALSFISPFDFAPYSCNKKEFMTMDAKS